MKHVDPVYLCLTAVYVAFLTAIVVLADLGWAPWVFSASKLVSWGDKPAHAFLMGLFAFFLNMALRGRSISFFRLRLLLGSVIVCVLVLAEELSQAFVRSRTADPLDAACDLIGIYLFGLLALWNLRQKAAQCHAPGSGTGERPTSNAQRPTSKSEGTVSKL